MVSTSDLSVHNVWDLKDGYLCVMHATAKAQKSGAPTMWQVKEHAPHVMERDTMLDLGELLKGYKLSEDGESRSNKICKGTFYRYKKSVYRTRRGFASTETFTKLKRMSCAGCNVCYGIDDAITDEFDNTGEFPIILPEDVKDGDVIRPFIVVGPPDWETGYPDCWEVHATVVRNPTASANTLRVSK